MGARWQLCPYTRNPQVLGGAARKVAHWTPTKSPGRNLVAAQEEALVVCRFQSFGLVSIGPRGQLVLDLDEFSLQRPIGGCVFIPLWTSGPGSTLCNASAGPKTFGVRNARPSLPLNGRQATSRLAFSSLTLRTMTDRVIRDPLRRCAAPGCPTVLSVYNSDHLCFTHADVRTRALFERRAASLRIDHPSTSSDAHVVRLLEPRVLARHGSTA